MTERASKRSNESRSPRRAYRYKSSAWSPKGYQSSPTEDQNQGGQKKENIKMIDSLQRSDFGHWSHLICSHCISYHVWHSPWTGQKALPYDGNGTSDGMVFNSCSLCCFSISCRRSFSCLICSRLWTKAWFCAMDSIFRHRCVTLHVGQLMEPEFSPFLFFFVLEPLFFWNNKDMQFEQNEWPQFKMRGVWIFISNSLKQMMHSMLAFVCCCLLRHFGQTLSRLR
jgi:hypothetical protein